MKGLETTWEGDLDDGDGTARAREAAGDLHRDDGLRRAGNPFYQRLNAILKEDGFDDFVEQLCAKFYAAKQGRRRIAPGVCFRMLLIGYYEGIGFRARDRVAEC